MMTGNKRFRVLLVSALAFAPAPCVLFAKADSAHRQTPRQLQQDPVEVPEIPFIDNNNGGIRYNPCSICQGVTLQSENIPRSSNYTCGELNEMLENLNQPESWGWDLSYDSCRSDFGLDALFEDCCRPSIPTYQCEQNVHKYISNQDYNTLVPPIVGNKPDEKLNVSIRLAYQALESLDVEEGTATIFVTLTMRWKDHRLKWDVDDNDTCANIVQVWTGYTVEETDIWIPDFQLMNEIEGTQTMPKVKATLFSDGTVSWGVTGGMKAFCAFRDLARIPFDELGCQLIFGSTSTRAHTNLINYVLTAPEDLYYGPFEVTYNEWKVIKELGTQGYVSENDTIYYNIFFKRSTKHYLRNIVLPTVILTYLSFLTFLLDMRIGERLGFGMALALVVVAQQIVTSGMTPISDQRLWLDNFVAWSFYWVLIGVIQSVLIGFLFFLREDKQSKMQVENGENVADEEELEPLAMPKVESEEPKSSDTASEYPDDEKRAKDCCFVSVCKDVVYTISLRKIDMVCLLLCVVTYTIFLILMILSGKVSKIWIGDDPLWFDESTPLDSLQVIYSNNDPNNR